MTSNKQLCILFAPLSTSGHINASVGLAYSLQKKGHRIVFATEKAMTGKLAALGFEEKIYTERDLQGEDAAKYWSDTMKAVEPHIMKAAKEKVFAILAESYLEFTDAIMFSDDDMKKILETVKPDVIVQDNYVCYPSFVCSGKPLIILNSANPLSAFDLLKSSKLPPPYCGLPLDDESEWNECRQIVQAAKAVHWEKFNRWFVERGAPSLPTHEYQLVSTNLNLFVYPKSLASDYLKRINFTDEWMGLDHAVRLTNATFDIPPKIKDLPGKLILLSMGSMGASVIDLMKKLVSILSKSKNKFIVSTGQDHDKYELADNMWGQPYIPQLAILPLVDLFITHGGNNSFVESLYFGKPMILLPLFHDQHDNAQRVAEMNVGIQLCPSSIDEDKLLKAIDTLTNDENMAARLKVISQEIRSSCSLDKAAEKIESIAANPKVPSVYI